MEVRDVGCMNSDARNPETPKKICVVDLRKESNRWFLLGMDVGA
jgi:hypothetical protein